MEVATSFIMAEQQDQDTQDTPQTTPGAGSGSTQGGAAGSGLGVSEASKARAHTDDLSRGMQDSVAAEHESAPTMTPAAAPQASRTSPASGDRGTGGGLGDAVGGARRASAAEMTGEADRVGDVSLQLPLGGSASQGAAVGAGMSRGAADPHPPGSADPGAGSALTDGDTPAPSPQRAGDSHSGLGDTATGGRATDFDSAFRNRDEKAD